MSAPTELRPGIIGRLIVVVAAAALFAYPFWTALGNLVNLPAYYADQFGVGVDDVPWVLLIAGVVVPAAVFIGAVVVTWKRGAGAMALVLTAGFAVVNAVALTILAFEKEVELRIVIDFLTGA